MLLQVIESNKQKKNNNSVANTDSKQHFLILFLDAKEQ